ncbi:hypothetical protein [Halovivax sp.]|uniref:hypothetical protein n=1 Tax=Halovivax sp. TaxID=1935978 RepID=UPI0025C2ED32|nr:hypothetical protein [Halovivax sp.]
MSLIDDLDSYAEPNDVGPDDRAPREPEGPPATSTGRFLVWRFESETSEVVPDTFVVARDPDPLDFRMWVFTGRADEAAFVLRASHRYAPHEAVERGREECCEVLMEGRSLRGEHCPEPVADFVAEHTGATVTFPDDEPDRGRDTPITY